MFCIPGVRSNKYIFEISVHKMATKKRIVFASGNAGKAREIRAMFTELFGDDVELLLQAELLLL